MLKSRSSKFARFACSICCVILTFANSAALLESVHPTCIHASSTTATITGSFVFMIDSFPVSELQPLLFQVVDVEPHIHRTMLRHKLGNVLLKVLLSMKAHVAEAHIAHRVVPFQDLIRILEIGRAHV